MDPFVTQPSEPRGLPGGIAPPAILLVLSMTGFIVAFRNPGLVDLGPHLSPAGVGILVAVVSAFWLLVAIGKRPPPR